MRNASHGTRARSVGALISTVLLGLCVAACAGTQGDSKCKEDEDLCDTTCVPAGLVCCNHGDGAICPSGYTCGTSAEQPCIPDGGGGDVLTISIQGSTAVPSNETPCGVSLICSSTGASWCPPSASPNPAAVRAGEPFRFRNDDSHAYTFLPAGNGAGAVPWTVAAPGEESGTLEIDAPGTYSFSVQECDDIQFGGHPLVGVLNVTVN